MKALLLENISVAAASAFAAKGFKVETLSAALDENELAKKIDGVTVLGVRSKSQVTSRVLEQAKDLLAVGAFCIGTDKINVGECSDRGVAVFNDPHSNSRSVAELALGEIIILARRVFASSTDLHSGKWKKTAAGAHEVRGLTLGIIGYGKIGSQLSDLAEALGMRVIFNDVSDVLARGNAKRASLEELLATADIVTIHIDGRGTNRNFFDVEKIAMMKDGACLLNLARGSIVDHEALAEALRSGKLSGASVDVFPSEPENNQPFASPLQNLPNVILTPHIGGSTEEAQENIGSFVSSRLLDYVRTGTSTLSVNFPHCQLELTPGNHRLMHLHSNMPGMLLHINEVLAKRGINIERQVLDTRGQLGYAIYDINQSIDRALLEELHKIPHTIRVRISEALEPRLSSVGA
ncbi:MAG TPA: phosphoglycerate dehydrogenase [Terriglobales bacterium]|nr:phosphoglycerate dehydrogenase [Terriglobales bacterium]